VFVTADRDEESGKFTEQYSRAAFLEAVDSIENATTTKIAEKVGCSYDLAYRRLKALEEGGEVSRTEIGSSFIWSR
jgi:CTP-dependent riboflavin kinase